MTIKTGGLFFVFMVMLLFSVLAFSSDENKNIERHLSLSFNEIPLRDLLELLAEFKGVNLIVSDYVSGNLSIHLKDVTWEQALDAVLTMKDLSLRKKDAILFVGSSDEIKEQNQTEEDTDEVTSEIFRVHYADAAVLSALVKDDDQFLSEDGSIVADTRTNALWLKDSPQKLQKLKHFLRQVDVPAKQVRIRAHIVNVDQNSMKELGLKFGTTSNQASRNESNQLHMDMPLTIGDVGHFTMAIAKLGSDTLLNLELMALEKEGHAKMISNPELVTAERQTASIESGQEIPYQENTSSGATNTAFKKAVLSLKVTPVVTPDDKILLNLWVNQDRVSDLVVNGVPAIRTQEVQTQVLVNNGETVVLGGIYEESSSAAQERIPFWGSIPIAGGLFKNKARHLERRELLIFVRPEII